MNKRYEFHSDPQLRPSNSHPDSPRHPEPYIASPELLEAVNLAIYLRRPLLLEGEAGCGKTRLARAIAYELGLPFYPWYIRSTSKAQEGLYSYDALARLHDSQIGQVEQRTDGEPVEQQKTKRPDPRNPAHYITLGSLGKAFTLRDQPAVVLIDEIDKADIDFPNDLLSVLDDPWEFKINEIDRVVSVSRDCRPIIIITSNKEKGNLPAPFLRRCLYYFIDFPSDETRLTAIIDAHFGSRSQDPPPYLVETAIKRFIALRNDLSLYKRPSTSELLDWIEALNEFRPYSPQILADESVLPYPELLLKMRADWHKYTTRQ